MKAGQNQKRSTTLHLALALSIAFLGSVFFEVIRPNVASAATFSEMSIEDRAEVWVMGRAVSECVKERGFESGNKNSTDINKGEWMNGQVGYDDPVDVGEWAADITEGGSDDSKAKCVPLAKKTLDLMGISGTEAVCKMNELAGKAMWERDNGDCRNGTGDYDFEEDHGTNNTDIWNRLFRDWLGGDVEASLTRGMRYIIYSENFYQECSHDNGEDWNNPREWKSGDKESDKVYKLKGLLQLGATPDKDWYVVSGGNGRGHDVHIDGYSMLTGDDKLQCKTLADRINDNASSYLEEVAKSTNPEDAEDGGDTVTDSGGTTTCDIDGIGWMICPVVRTIAVFNDSLFALLKSLLGINPSMFDTTGGGKATFQSWQAMRDISNVAFVIAFMVIVYSQLTSAGISNYGIKKMLPRIVVAAILVNISFFICAIAVDISNIVGSSLHELLVSQTKAIGGETGANLGEWDKITSWLIAGGVGSVAVGGAALTVGAYGFLGALALLIPLAITALIAALTVVFVLVARQALVIILIVVSPLAFVAYLLPNTEQWFTRWRKTFFSMLLIYPLVALLFGGSQLASAVIRGGADDALVYVLSLVVLVLPLFATPFLIKFSGGLIGQIAGMVNNPNRGVFDRMKKAGKGFSDSRRDERAADALNGGGGRFGGLTRFGARRNARREGFKRRRAAAEKGFLATDERASAFERSTFGNEQTANIQEAINKAAGEIEHIDANVDLHVRGKIAETDLGSIKAEQKAMFKEISTEAGAAAHPEIADHLKTQMRSAVDTTHLNELREGSAGVQLQREQTEELRNQSGQAAQYAGGIDEHGAMRVSAAAKAAQSKEMFQNIDNIQNTTDYTVASDNTELERRFAAATTTEERVAYARLMRGNGSPGVESLKRSLSNFTGDPQNAGTPAELDLKEILAADSDFRSAGRDFEVWSNNEQPGKTFKEVSNDTSIWSDQSAQRFASMSKPAQMKFIANLATNNPAELHAFVARFKADPTAVGRVKGAPQEMLEIFENGGDMSSYVAKVDKGM